MNFLRMMRLNQIARVNKSEGKKVERETGFEPATSTLARSHSTTELFPLSEGRGYFYRNSFGLSSKD